MREMLDNSSITIELDTVVMLDKGSYYNALVDRVKKSGRGHIVLDFSRVDFIDDCALQAIVKLVERFGRKGYIMALRNPKKSILKLLVFYDIVDRIDVNFTDDYRL